MQPIRIIYDDTPDSIPVPEALRHQKTEIILWPLEDKGSAEERSAKAGRRERKPGSARGKLTMIAEDEEHLDDFKDFIEAKYAVKSASDQDLQQASPFKVTSSYCNI